MSASLSSSIVYSTYIPFLLHLHVGGSYIPFDWLFRGPTIFGHVALLPAIVANTFKSLPLRALVVTLLSSPQLWNYLVASSFVTIFVSTFGRRLTVDLTFICVECFFFTHVSYLFSHDFLTSQQIFKLYRWWLSKSFLYINIETSISWSQSVNNDPLHLSFSNGGLRV